MENHLRELRLKAGLSQNALAQRVRMHPSHICQLERGLPTTKRTISKLAIELQVRPEALCPDFAMLPKGWR